MPTLLNCPVEYSIEKIDFSISCRLEIEGQNLFCLYNLNIQCKGIYFQFFHLTQGVILKLLGPYAQKKLNQV